MLAKNKSGWIVHEYLDVSEGDIGKYKNVTGSYAIIRIKDKYLIGYNNWRDQWEFPAGGIEAGETARQAAFVERGDIWTVGSHRLMCGDATSTEDVAALMDGKKANLVVTDPPYNVAFESSDGLSIKNDKMENDKFYEFLLAAFKNMAEHLEKGGSAYVFHADTEGLNFRKAFIDAGFHLSGCCIWVKNSLVLGRSDYQWQHEPVLYGFFI